MVISSALRKVRKVIKLRTEKAQRRKGTASGVRYYDDTARHNRAIGTRSTLVTQLIDI